MLYGILRKWMLNSLIHDDFGPLFPYLMNSPLLKFGVVSAQEVVGWSVAALISWLLSDSLLRRFRIEPGPYRTALVAFFCMTSVCLAVETAAIGSDWWIWTIKQPNNPIFGRVPLVGILDWGFVAFDFLLPFLLFASAAPWASRLISLTLFPLHFLFHPKAIVLPEPVPLTPNDLMHGGIFAYVLVRTIGETKSSLLPDPSRAEFRWFPSIAILIVVLSTAISDIFVAKNPSSAFASLPLLLLGVIAFSGFLRKAEKTARIVEKRLSQSNAEYGTASRKAPSSGKKRRAITARNEPKSQWRALYQFAAVLVVLSAVYFLRAPFHRKTQQFVEKINIGAEKWNSGNAKGAEKEFREAIQVRPDQPSGHAILGQLLFQQQRNSEARNEMEQALELNPTERAALVVLTTIDLKEKRWKDAFDRSTFGNKIYPDRPEFLYQKGLAEHNIAELQQTASQSIDMAIDTARKGGPEQRQALAVLAISFNDASTAKAVQ